MTDDHPSTPVPAAAPATPPPGGSRRVGLKIALVGAGIAAGALGATAFGAAAADNSSSTAPSYSSTAPAPPNGAPAPNGAPDRDGDGPHGGPGGMRGPGGVNPMRPDEKSVSSDVAAKLKAAALAKVPGGSVVRVETDAGDAAYEAHVTKADGTVVTVKFDKNYAVTAVEDGMGKGDPMPQHQDN